MVLSGTFAMNDARQAEIAKYSVQYQNPYYRMGGSRKREIIRVLNELQPKGTLLDVGTGRGETLALAKQYGHAARGTEVVPYLLEPELVTYAEAHALPFKDGEFDHVTCFDVLEHLLLPDIHAALSEFARVARHTVTVTASVKSHVVNGVELHPSAMSMEDWTTLILEAWFPCNAYRHGMGGKFSGCWQMRK
jgi:ubiquinone/menaquinone biosynthesis C-methylase UbiE